MRILHLRDRARREPAAPCTEVLSEEEWQALYAHATGAAATAATPVPPDMNTLMYFGPSDSPDDYNERLETVEPALASAD